VIEDTGENTKHRSVPSLAGGLSLLTCSVPWEMNDSDLRDLIFPKTRVENGRAVCLLCGEDFSTNSRPQIAPSTAKVHLEARHLSVLSSSRAQVRWFPFLLR
jgi:hypothetical protein